ncbi:Jem1 protein [Martiniozyma asiatica (nom. inval.)]|nr:Jem1 protein [Martiniozyma asiatica]
MKLLLLFPLILGIYGLTLEEVDADFKVNGASLEILEKYDFVIKDLQNSNDSRLSSVYYKHGLINYALNRDKIAWEDYLHCINQKKCLEQFIDLSFKIGKVEELGHYLQTASGELGDVVRSGKLKVENYNNNMISLNNLITQGSFDEADDLSYKLLQEGPHNINILKQREFILVHKNKNSSGVEIDERIKELVEVYSKLVKSGDLESYGKLARIQLFKGGQSETGRLIKDCLRLDNDFADCRALARINIKLQKITDLIKMVDDYYSSVYVELEEDAQGDLEWIKEKEPSVEDWKQINQSLFHSEKKIKMKNIIDRNAFEGVDVDSAKTNFEIIIQLYIITMEKFGFQENSLITSPYLVNLFKLSKESYMQIGDLAKLKTDNNVLTHPYYKKIQEIINKKDVVDVAIELDKALKKRNIEKLESILSTLSNTMKSTKLIQQRIEKINRLKEQNQDHSQQHQQGGQRFYQQQYQRAPASKPKPANDYYKVLGVERDADASTIKKAYREQMRKNHPDKMKGSELSEEEIENKVALINNAYEVLSDSDKKREYDEFGNDPNDPENDRRQHQYRAQQQQQQQGFPGGFRFQGSPGGAPGGGFNFGGFNFGGFGQQQQQQQHHQQRAKPRGKAKNRRAHRR